MFEKSARQSHVGGLVLAGYGTLDPSVVDEAHLPISPRVVIEVAKTPQVVIDSHFGHFRFLTFTAMRVMHAWQLGVDDTFLGFCRVQVNHDLHGRVGSNVHIIVI